MFLVTLWQVSMALYKKGEKMKFKMILIFAAILLVVASSFSFAGENEDIEKLREEQLRKWGTEGILKPKKVTKEIESYLGKPLNKQSVKDLKLLAKQANTAAKLVGFVLEKYSAYYRDNYKYDFVQEKVAPFHDKYVYLSNGLIDYRNQAYFNLGLLTLANGKEVEAFFYFKDAYRLSSFTASPESPKGMRYKAEQEMKKILAIEDIPSFLHWKE
jgi:hypothetical protein